MEEKWVFLMIVTNMHVFMNFSFPVNVSMIGINDSVKQMSECDCIVSICILLGVVEFSF